jgi:HK97 family phage major capsid protein
MEDNVQKNLRTIEKAFTTSDIASAGVLNPEQANRFIRDVQKSTVMIKECRVVPMNSPKRDFDKIGFGSRISQKATEATAPGTTSEPTTSQVELSTEEYIAAVDLSYSSLEDNIERAQLEQTVMELIAEQVGLDIEELAIRADADGATGDAFLDSLDGWFELAGHTVNHSNAAFSFATVFKNAYDQLPKKYLKQKGLWRFYVDEDVHSLFQDEVMQGKYVTANAGWITADKDNVLSFKGVPVIGVPQISLAEGSTGTPSVATSPMLLAHPQNLVWGVQRKVTVETWRNRRSRTLEITVTYRVDFKIEETDAVVKTTNIKHALS